MRTSETRQQLPHERRCPSEGCVVTRLSGFRTSTERQESWKFEKSPDSIKKLINLCLAYDAPTRQPGTVVIAGSGVAPEAKPVGTATILSVRFAIPFRRG
jgi:hypothetical protein